MVVVINENGQLLSMKKTGSVETQDGSLHLLLYVGSSNQWGWTVAGWTVAINKKDS